MGPAIFEKPGTHLGCQRQSKYCRDNSSRGRFREVLSGFPPSGRCTSVVCHHFTGVLADISFCEVLPDDMWPLLTVDWSLHLGHRGYFYYVRYSEGIFTWGTWSIDPIDYVPGMGNGVTCTRSNCSFWFAHSILRLPQDLTQANFSLWCCEASFPVLYHSC